MKDPQYLRVKNWGKFQHYRDREPGWIKLYADAIRDSRFLELTEAEQWQLVRIWIWASQSARFTVDEEGRRVPVIANDERNMRRTIATLKKIPLPKLIREGWLILVTEDELWDGDAAPLPADAAPPPPPSPRPALDDAYTETSPALDASRARARTRGNRETRRTSERPTGRLSTEASYDTLTGLPVENEFQLQRLIAAVRPHGDEHTPAVLRSHAAGLPEAALTRVIESVTGPSVRDRARYAVAALKSEREERTAA